MTDEIDFLKTEREKGFTQAKAARPLKLGSFIFLVVYCLAAAGIFAYWLSLDRASKKIARQINLKKERIQELKKVESLQVLLKQRLSSLTKVLSEKKPIYSQIISYFEEISPEGLIFSNLNFSEKGEVVLTGEAVNILALDEFLTALKSRVPDEIVFSEIVLSSMNRVKEGNYQFNLLIKTDEKPETT